MRTIGGSYDELSSWWCDPMSTPSEQTISREVYDDGTIEVSVTPLLTNVKSQYVDDSGMRHVGIVSEPDLRAICNIPEDYECISWKPNSWVQQDEDGPFIAHQAKGSFKPPPAGKFVIESLLERLANKAPVVPSMHKAPIDDTAPRRMLEVSIMDPHLGLQCFTPGADANYNLDIAEDLYMWAIKELAILGSAYDGIEEILFPIGNDFLHAEPIVMSKGIGHGTAGGTAQPEMTAWHETYERGEELLRKAILFLSQIAPVTVLEVPGNHDRYSAFTLARVMNAYFSNNDDVTVECDPAPYKFKKFGVNLIGFEHGHSVAQIRLAALMANECSSHDPNHPRYNWWQDSKYREWHLGDQHRKGSAKPSVLEEQGVSVEFLPSLTAPNEWHKLKSFNWQKRGAMGWVWDYNHGPTARLQVNIDSESGLPYKA